MTPRNGSRLPRYDVLHEFVGVDLACRLAQRLVACVNLDFRLMRNKLHLVRLLDYLSMYVSCLKGHSG